MIIDIKQLKEDFFLFCFKNAQFDLRQMQILNILFELLIQEQEKRYLAK